MKPTISHSVAACSLSPDPLQFCCDSMASTFTWLNSYSETKAVLPSPGNFGNPAK